MPLPTIPSGNVASALPSGYEVANSCRFNSADSAQLSKSVGSSATTKYTLSLWVKRGIITNGTGNGQRFFTSTGGSGLGDTYFRFNTDDTIEISGHGSSATAGGYVVTNRKFRDPSAWYHIVIRYDSTESSANDRFRLYINGVDERTVGGYSSSTMPNSSVADNITASGNTIRIGATASAQYFDGYMAEIHFSEGQSYAPTEYGEYNEDSPTIWQPKKADISYGTSGFYLDFEDSSNLGNDANGGTDFTETNIVAADQATDSPTNNFCTINPLYIATSDVPTFAQGNCELTQNATTWRSSIGTIGVSSGKWYFECKGGRGTAGYTHYGWASTSWLHEKGDGSENEPSTNHNGPCVTYYGSNGNNYYSTSSTTGSNGSYGDSWDNDHTIGCFLDLDNNKAYWSKDGTLQNSGTGYSIESGFTWLPVIGSYDTDGGSGESIKVNFGGCPATTISSGNTDGTYGNFEYTTTITGDGSSKTFKALCTKNVAEDG